MKADHEKSKLCCFWNTDLPCCRSEKIELSEVEGMEKTWLVVGSVLICVIVAYITLRFLDKLISKNYGDEND